MEGVEVEAAVRREGVGVAGAVVEDLEEGAEGRGVRRVVSLEAYEVVAEGLGRRVVAVALGVGPGRREAAEGPRGGEGRGEVEDLGRAAEVEAREEDLCEARPERRESEALAEGRRQGRGLVEGAEGQELLEGEDQQGLRRRRQEVKVEDVVDAERLEGEQEPRELGPLDRRRRPLGEERVVVEGGLRVEPVALAGPRAARAARALRRGRAARDARRQDLRGTSVRRVPTI